MGNFYNPQPPSQGPTNSTLPLPHDPIPAQGDQPPRRQTAVVLAMCAVLASWPLDQEPRLQPPNAQQVKIAALTLTYGSQPTPTSALSVSELAQIVTAWPNPIGPVLPYQPIRSLVVTAPTVSQPQPQSPLSVLEVAQIVSTWTVTWDAQSAPKSASWNVPLLVTLPRSVPPAWIWTSWEPPYVKPPQPVSIAPLTLVYGSQPSPQPPLNRVAQTVIVASWPIDIGPSVSWPNATPTRIVPLTLPRGDQPRPQGPLGRTTLTQTVLSWVQTWNAQRGPSAQVQPGAASAVRPQVFQLLAAISNLFTRSASRSDTTAVSASSSGTFTASASTSTTFTEQAGTSSTFTLEGEE